MRDARLVVIGGAGHAVHLEQPAAFENAVIDFLDGVAPATQAPAAAADGECRSASQ